MGLITPPEHETVVAGVSPNWLTTKLTSMADWAVNWSRANSLWPMPFGTACCAIEFMATAASRFDLARFGMERMSFSPRQADVLLCAGRLPFKLAPVIRRIYDQMPQPKWVISMGACASTGGIFDNYAMVQGIDTVVPVDVYVPGCPPRPEGLLHGILMLHQKIRNEHSLDPSLRDQGPLGLALRRLRGETMYDPALRDEQPLDPKTGLRMAPEAIDEISEPFGNSIHQTRSA
ncbi:MAG TPA: NADH-quinone oxidoreductase subunit NuoB [Gemmatimonadales bacterium]|jgi:NADH-quinone oxidoreductase subunit B